MSFNRRGGPDRRPSRPGGRGTYPPRDRSGYPPRDQGGYPPRDRDARPEGADRPPGRSFGPRRFDRPPDDGGMSLRLDPRRLRTLKDLAGEAGMRPGELARLWVEERIDASRTGAGGESLDDRISALESRIAALEGRSEPPAPADPQAQAETAPSPVEEPAAGPAPAPAPRARRKRVSAAPTARVGLHDEMIAVLSERGPMTAGELATAVAERGRYAPPRSGKPIDAAMVSQRASNPTYRSRFVRREGRIGLAEVAG